MTIVAANWVGENTSTVGTGPLALSGAISTFCPFSVLPDGSEVYYTLQEGFNRETGIGVVSNGTLTRKVQATLVAGVYAETDIPISLSGNGQVFAVINADFMTRIYNFSLDVADSVSAAAASAQQAAKSASLASDYEESASNSADAAAASELAAHNSQVNAASSETNSKISENNAKTSETNAAKSATDAANSAATIDVAAISANIATKANKGANSDITSLSGLTTPLSAAQGGTGNKNNSATSLTTSRTFITNLASTTAAGFNGTDNNSHGVTGTLPIANGGTGGSTLAAAQSSLGIVADAFSPASVSNVPWSVPTMQNGFSITLPTKIRTGYRKVLGMLQLCLNVSADGAKNDGTIITILPAGYRPAIIHSVLCAVLGVDINGARVDINPNGEVTCQGYNGSTREVRFQVMIPLE